MSTCRGAAPPHKDCPHGKLCDWDGHNVEKPVSGKVPRVQQTFKSLRDRRRKLGLLPVPQEQVQLVLSRRERRKVAIAARKASKKAQIAAQRLPAASDPATAAAWVLGVALGEANDGPYSLSRELAIEPGPAPAVAVLDLTLKQLRTLAQDKGIRVDGKRPSLCTKAELQEALSTAATLTA